MKALILTSVLFLANSTFALSVPKSMTYQGRILKANGQPLESTNITFRFQIYSPDGACLLFEEEHLRDMTDTEGVFSLNIGEGSNTNATNLNLVDVFNPSLSKVGQGSCPYSPADGDSLRFRFTYVDGATTVTLPVDQLVRSVPLAFHAMTLEGLGKSAFLQTSATTTQSKINDLAGAHTALMALSSGTSNLYSKSTDLPISGGVLNMSGSGVRVADVPASADHAVNRNYADARMAGREIDTAGMADGKVLAWSQADNKWKAILPEGGTVTSITAGTGLSGGTIVGSGTISLSAVGTAGTYFKVTTDAYGRVTAGSALQESDLPSITTPGKISGSTITSGTIAGNTAVNTTGNITATNLSVNGASAKTLLLYEADASHKVTFVVPSALSADYTLTLPSALGTAGQVLSTNATGELSWITPTAATSITAGAGLSGGTIVGSGTISLATVGTAGTYFKVTTDAYGRVTAGSALQESDLPSITTPGKISGSTITSGTIGGNTAINTTGSVTAANLSVNNAAVKTLQIFDGDASNKVSFVVPTTLSSDYTLTFPTALGAAGQVLSTSATGELSWITPVASGAVGGDLSGSLPNPTVAKIKGTTVSSTSLMAGQFYKYSGGELTPAYANISDLKTSAGLFQFPTNCTISQVPIYSSLSDRFTCTDITLSAAQVPNISWTKVTSDLPTTVAGYGITDAVKNGGGVSTFKAGLEASKPTAGNSGHIYFATDSAKVYFDTGSVWVLLASAQGSGGTVTSVAAGSGLTGGTITQTGTLAVDTGTGANKIVKLDGSARLPAVDGSQLTNISTFTHNQVFDADASWSVPAGVTRVYVQVWGGGGGGAGGNTGLSAGGGTGGGGGAYASEIISIPTSTTSVLITVGAGGGAGPKGGANTQGLVGGESKFGALLSAGGGAGGAMGSTLPALGGITSAVLGILGGQGTPGSGVNGGPGGVSPGGGGLGGMGAYVNTSPATNGGAPGGGGGGGYGTLLSGSNGGAGAAGRVVVWW